MPGLIKMLNDAIAVYDRDRDTFQVYAHWNRKFYQFIRKPASQWTGADVDRWMAHLYHEQYAAKSRKQALCALVFVFKRVLKRDLGTLNLPPMPKEHKPLRTIPTREEIAHIFIRLSGQSKLMAGLMYGSGLRVEECCKLRVQDIDFSASTVRIHCGKGNKSRLAPLAAIIVPALKRYMAWRMELHEKDIANGFGFVDLPGRLEKKYANANRELRWQFLFASVCVRNGFRWHTTPEAVQGQMRRAVMAARITKRVTPHTLRHAFATHALEIGNNIEWLRDRMGHEDLNTTAIYLHADRAGGLSPLDGRQTVRVLTPQRITFEQDANA